MQIQLLHSDEFLQLEIGSPYLVYAGKIEEGKETRCSRCAHSHHDFIEFIYVLNGCGQYEIANKHYTIKKGDLIIYDSGVVHYETVNDQTLPILYCAASGIQRPNMRPNTILSDGIEPVFHLEHRRQLFKCLMQEIFDVALMGKPCADTICQSLFCAFLHLTIDLIDTNGFVQCEKMASTCQLGYKIRDFVDMQDISSISIPQVADFFHISESYLARIFKQTFGCSLTTYLVRRKIGDAQTLLLSTDFPISEIAKQVGYQNQSHFTKTFTKHVGHTPLRYRKIHKTIEGRL